MNLFTVSFFGHRRIINYQSVEESVDKVVRMLIRDKEYVDFLVGRDGDFDQIVSSAIIRAKKYVFAENSSHICVFPYQRAIYTNNQEAFENYYDEIEICAESSLAHPKRAIQIRNRCMVDRSDLVVFFTQNNYGGAYQTLRYAVKQGKEIINLAELQ